MNRKTLCGLLLLAGTLLSAGNVEPDPDSSPYGVCAHLNRMPAKERIAELQRMKQTGIRFFRTDLDWAQVEPTPGKWNFAEWDSVVSEARKLGLRPVAILGGNLPAHGKPPFEKMDAWKRYVETVVRRYRNDILYYEVINEAELIKLMEDRPDLKYVTDIMPVANEEFAAKFPGRYFSTPKKMGAQTAEANINAGIAAARQIVGFLKDGCEKFRVNKK